MERQLALAQEWLSLALASAKSVAWDWDIRSGYWACFGDLKTMFGRTTDTVEGTIEDFREYVHHDDRERVQEALEETIRNRTPFRAEFRIRRPDGRVRWVASTGGHYYSETGAPERMMGVAVDVTDRHEAEEQRRLSEQRLAQFFASVPEYCYVVLPSGVIGDVNPAACQALGYRRHELIGKPLAAIFAPEVGAKIGMLFEKWKTAGELHNEEVVVLTQTGERRIVLLSAGTVRDSHGNTLHSTAVQVDITERKQAEEKLRLGEERLRIAAEAGHMYAFEWDPATDKVTRSQECAAVLGLAREPNWNTATEFFPSIHPDDIGPFMALIAGLSPHNNRYRTEYRVMRPDGSSFWVEENSHAYFNDQGRMTRLVGMVADINTRKRAEKRLEISERLNREIIMNSPVAMALVHELEGTTAFFNQRFTSLFGYTSADVANVSQWWPLAYPDPVYRERLRAEWQRNVEETLRSGQPMRPMEATVTCKDGSTREVEFHFSPIGSAEIVTFIDLTDRKQSERELLELNNVIAHMNRVASMGEMAAALAHEIGQPLTALLSNAQAAVHFLNREWPPLDEVRAALADIVEDATRCGDIVKNLRGIFRKQVMPPERVDLNRVVEDIGRLAEKHSLLRGARLSLLLSPQPLFVRGEISLLQQVMMNLVNNSADAMGKLPHGQRHLTIRTTRPAGDKAIVRVEDNGPGVPANEVRKLFTPFHTTKSQGLGMGLCLCQNIARSFGGRITYEGGPGAIFQVELPLVTAL